MARNFRPRQFGISGAYLLRRSVERGSVPIHERRTPPAETGLLITDSIPAGPSRMYNPHGDKIISVRVMTPTDTNTDESTREHGTTQQPTDPAQAARPSESTTSTPPAVTATQAAAAARIRVAADRKNGRKTADWIVKLAHGA